MPKLHINRHCRQERRGSRMSMARRPGGEADVQPAPQRSPKIERRPNRLLVRHQRRELADVQNDRRKPVAVAQREDMADKQGMVAAIVPRRHFGGDGRDGMREQGRVAGILVFRIDAFDRPTREMTDQGFLPTGENVHAEMS